MLVGPDDLSELVLDMAYSLVDYFGEVFLDRAAEDMRSEDVEVLFDARIRCHKLPKFC